MRLNRPEMSALAIVARHPENIGLTTIVQEAPQHEKVV
jgi:hypothetical protein